MEHTEKDTREFLQFLRKTTRRELERDFERCKTNVAELYRQTELAKDRLALATAELNKFDHESNELFAGR